MIALEKIIRDITLFMLLLVLSRTALERAAVQISKEKTSVWEPIAVHELDQDFLTLIEDTKKQINKIIDKTNSLANSEKKKNQLKNLKTQVESIEKKYKKNSPATFILGPIGTSAIVLKEKKLEKELSKIKKQLELISKQ